MAHVREHGDKELFVVLHDFTGFRNNVPPASEITLILRSLCTANPKP